MKIEQVILGGQLFALILRNKFNQPGIHFFTPNDFSQQLAYMKHPKGYEIDSHVHKAVPRKIEWTQEVLFIKSGRVRVDFYDKNKAYIETRILGAGDIILLAHGGHGLTMLEESEIIEVKQGPYSGEVDKIRFDGVKDADRRLKE